MTDSSESQPILPYRALTETSSRVLGERITQALRSKYVTYGPLRFATKPAENAHFGQITCFVQLVISPAIVQVMNPRLDYKEISIVEGRTDRAFCEEVSTMLERGWLLYDGPKIFVQGSEFRLLQQLVQA